MRVKRNTHHHHQCWILYSMYGINKQMHISSSELGEKRRFYDGVEIMDQGFMPTKRKKCQLVKSTIFYNYTKLLDTGLINLNPSK